MKKRITKVTAAAIITAMLIVCSVFSTFAEAVSFDNTKFIPGDANNDFAANIYDATLIQKAIVGLETLSYEQQLAADFNGDNSIEISDVTEIQKKIANLNYKCLAVPDNSYKSINTKIVTDSSFEISIQFEKVIDEVDDFQGGCLNRNGIYIIKSLDAYYDLFGYCRAIFDKNFFEENSLIVWTDYIPKNSDFIYDFREITAMSVEDNALKLRCTHYIPFIDNFSSPYDRNCTLIYKVKKSDVENIDNLINVCNEWIDCMGSFGY